MEQNYTPEQVQQILVRAMERNQQERYSRLQLEEMATDLDISPEALAWAEYDNQKLASTAQFSTAQNSNQEKLYHQLKTFLVVNAFLLALDFTLNGTITWALYPLLGWGLGLLLP